MTKTVLLLILLLHLAKSQNAEYMEVSLGQGRLRGFRSADQKSFRFLGIPYAGPPTGENRFKAPTPPPMWDDVMNATNSVRCPQLLLNTLVVGDEDCLKLNVFVPATAQLHDNLPILFFVHGGGYVIGSGDLNPGGRLIDEDIIVVTTNYRLGIPGYICLRTEEAPGNAASKDQVAALRWVQNNIRSFGGNPADVTVYGTSSGSVSADLLSLSKMTTGLFNKIILESGAAVSGWSLSYDPIRDAKTTAKAMGFENVDDMEALAEFYINATPRDLVRALRRDTSDLPSQSSFQPCIEKDIDGAFLTDTPMSIMRIGDYEPVPAMIIYMDMECISFVPNWYIGWNTVFREEFHEFLPPNLGFQNDLEKRAVGENIKEEYLNRTESEMNAYIEVLSDMYFIYSAIESARLHSRLAPVYLMEFSYHDMDDLTQLFDGAGHGDFYLHLFEIWLKGQNGDLAADRLTKLVGNFIKYTNPVPETTELLHVTWPTVSPSVVNYMSFDQELSIRQSPIPDRYQLWSGIHNRHFTDAQRP